MWLVMIITGALTLTDEQINAIGNIILGGKPLLGVSPLSSSMVEPGETISGLPELARLIGTSVPTACKLAKSGKFDAARLNFGTRKTVWDKAKLLEIARTK